MIMSASTNTVGLCSTCNNSPTCFHRARRGPALFCELFDDYVPPPLEVTGRRTSQAADPPLAVRAEAADVATYAGLCINCAHRHTCTHATRAGGVWHCENYE